MTRSFLTGTRSCRDARNVSCKEHSMARCLGFLPAPKVAEAA
ncbi:hypothetical protein ACTU44_00695 [Thalassospira sp. SM2505]